MAKPLGLMLIRMKDYSTRLFDDTAKLQARPTTCSSSTSHPQALTALWHCTLIYFEKIPSGCNLYCFQQRRHKCQGGLQTREARQDPPRACHQHHILGHLLRFGIAHRCILKKSLPVRMSAWLRCIFRTLV